MILESKSFLREQWHTLHWLRKALIFNALWAVLWVFVGWFYLTGRSNQGSELRQRMKKDGF